MKTGLCRWFWSQRWSLWKMQRFCDFRLTTWLRFDCFLNPFVATLYLEEDLLLFVWKTFQMKLRVPKPLHSTQRNKNICFVSFEWNAHGNPNETMAREIWRLIGIGRAIKKRKQNILLLQNFAQFSSSFVRIQWNWAFKDGKNFRRVSKEFDAARAWS